MNIDSFLKNIPKITPKYAKILEKLGLLTVKDFLYYLPFRYDDFTQTVALSEDLIDKTITVEAIIKKIRVNRIWKKRLTILEVFAEDENGTSLKVVWFNQPFIADSLLIGSPFRFSGKLEKRGRTFSISNPAWERASREKTNTGCLVPVYRETAGLTSKWIRWQMKIILPLAKEIPDILPVEIRRKYNLYDIFTALSELHFPSSQEKMIRAQKRMAFEEMFLAQLKALETKKKWDKKNSTSIKFNEKLIKRFVAQLPFQLTNAQRKASFEILKDLEKPHPMNRLLNGDVGSGKTIIAAIAAFQTISSSYQTALMAPTEVLARQHFESLCELFKESNFNIVLLTGSYKLSSRSQETTRQKLLAEIKKGSADLIIGTHALIQKDVYFKKLALAIVDEQHRFGVMQRAALQNETENIHDGFSESIPHFLTMTATPIPRTLSIAFFGSLDLSFLDEMPKNRKPIITKNISEKEREKTYFFIENEIKKGRQVFIILPLIEESLSESMADVKAVKEEHKRLSEKVFFHFKVGLLHGKLKPKEKEEVMRKFKQKEFNILVSTSVVEVGIDIPNATIMLIENAERFGLSQLHQFRGRVGRGRHQSYCFLFTGANTKIPSRLKTMEKTNNGFEIAEYDLKLRGPGQFFGTLQSGLPDITMENLSNIKLIKFARLEAQEILNSDPQLKKHPFLSDALKRFNQKVHLE